MPELQKETNYIGKHYIENVLSKFKNIFNQSKLFDENFNTISNKFSTFNLN
jgi:hypothetical protein